MFWAYGDFSNVERISSNSFLKNGFKLNIWTYGELTNAPSGATLRDAREILPESSFFSLPNGSCSPFSDFFRYAVLNTIGGLWADTDVIALTPASQIYQRPFFVTERHQTPRLRRIIKETLSGKTLSELVGNLIFNPTPSKGNIIDLAYHYCERFPKEKVKWGELGPSLLTAIEKIYPDHGFRIMPPEFANCFGYWKCPEVFLTPGIKVPQSAVFCHLYNETWRNAKVDKNSVFPDRSLMGFFAKQYL
jgi:hypothetical protein